MRTELAGLAGDVTGTLSLASLPSATAPLIAPQLREFAERYPAVTIRLLEGSEQEVLDWLDQGAAEAGVVRLPARGLETAALGEQVMVAVVPADSWLASKEVVELRRAGQGALRPRHGRLRRRADSDRAAGRRRVRRGFRSARSVGGARDRPGGTRGEHPARAPACPSCPTVSSCARWSREPYGLSVSPSPPAHPRPPARSSTRSRRSISSKSRPRAAASGVDLSRTCSSFAIWEERHGPSGRAVGHRRRRRRGDQGRAGAPGPRARRMLGALAGQGGPATSANWSAPSRSVSPRRTASTTSSPSTPTR